MHVKIETGLCRASAALERHKDSKKKAKDRASGDEKKEWGKFYYTNFELLPPEKEAGTPMPTRMDFYRSQKLAV